MIYIDDKQKRNQILLREIATAKQEMADMVTAWDRDGFKPEDCDDLKPDFNILIPYAASLKLAKTEAELKHSTRIHLMQIQEQWIKRQRSRYTEGLCSNQLFPDIDYRYDYKGCDMWWHKKNLYHDTSEYILGLCEGRPLIEFLAPSMTATNGGGVSIPIDHSGMEAFVFCHDPTKPIDQMYGHPKFPKDQYKLTKGKRGKPVFRYYQ